MNDINRKYRPVKLEDLAKKLKVSKVTVSKALRGHPDISPSTTERVKELAEKLGYMPNAMAKNLSARRSNNIGLVVPKIAHFFFASVIESIYNTAFENNYEIVLTVSQEKFERERKHILSLLSMRVDGLLISVTQETKDTSIYERVINSGVPLVFIDRVPEMSGISSVTVNDIEGAFSAVNYGIKKGYRKIAHIGGNHNINIGRARYEGFLKAMRENRMPINNNWVIEGGYGEEDGYNGFKKMYEKKNIPQYIFADTYPIALGIYTAAKEYGLNIPEDLEVTCFGKNTFNRFTPSVFNFVDQPTQELGSEAVKLMIEQINNPSACAKNIILDTALIISNGKNNKEIAG